MVNPLIQKQILSVLSRKSGISQKEIVLTIGFSERCVRNNLRFLEEAGLVSVARDIRNLNFKRYSLRGDVNG